MRLVILWVVICLFALFAFSLILLSIKFYMIGMVGTQEILVSLEEENFAGSQAQDLANEVSGINEELGRLEFFYKNQMSFSNALSLVIRAMPDQTRLNTVYLSIQSEDDKQKFKSSLTGFSSDRETLFFLKRNLENEPSFAEIDFPPSNWVRPTDINFSVNFNVNGH